MASRTSLILGAAAVGMAPFAAAGLGVMRYQRQMAREVEELFANSHASDRSPVTEEDLVDLPKPVQRWLRYSGVIGKPIPAAVRLKQTGRIRQDETRPWMHFAAEEYFTTDPPAFIWKATASMGRILCMLGRDRYDDGKGRMDFSLLGLIPVVSATGPEMNQGAAIRYLNELMWFPAAALSAPVYWQSIDHYTAEASLRHYGRTVTGTFRIDDEGKLTTMVAQRYRSAGSGYSLETWETPISDYRDLAGLRLPAAGAGVWNLASGDLRYIELNIDHVEYDNPHRY